MRRAIQLPGSSQAIAQQWNGRGPSSRRSLRRSCWDDSCWSTSLKRALEQLERDFTAHALGEHRDAVSFWYRGLELYRRAMIGAWEYLGDEGPEDKMTAWGIRMQLLGLGVGSAKATLDLLLAGYYSMSFAGIRHMVEGTIQSIYLSAFPEESPLWYGKPGRRAREYAAANPNDKQAASKEHQPPGCKAMVEDIKNVNLQDARRAATMDSMYDSWRLMCKGAHPSAEGMRQTSTDDTMYHVLGSTYDEELCLVGLDHGLCAIHLQLVALTMLKSQSEEWTNKHAALRTDIRAWRHAMEVKLSTPDFIAPDDADA